MSMKRLLLLLPFLMAGSANSETYFHSFPDIGPTGMYCSVSIIGNQSTTSCRSGLTSQEQIEDSARHEKDIVQKTKKLGYPENYCEIAAQVSGQIRLDVHNKEWADDPEALANKPITGDGYVLDQCKRAMYFEEQWEPRFLSLEGIAVWNDLKNRLFSQP